MIESHEILLLLDDISIVKHSKKQKGRVRRGWERGLAPSPNLQTLFIPLARKGEEEIIESNDMWMGVSLNV